MGLTTFKYLTEEDRLNLCDLAWFLRGINYGKEKQDQPVGEEHFRTLERVIDAIKNHEIDSRPITKEGIRNS